MRVDLERLAEQVRHLLDREAILFVQRRRDEPKVDIGGGRYIDRLERRNGEWLIAARELVIDWTARADSAVYAEVASYTSGRWDRNDLSHRRPFELQPPRR